jgi:hypothetical protein
VHPSQVDAWTLGELPRLNRAILTGGADPAVLRDALRDAVLPELPVPDRLSRHEAARLLVGLGFAGASVARHHQERVPGGKEAPERAFDDLAVGAAGTAFREYFGRLADRTGTGHYHRESYASLVRWNVGTVQVTVNGRPIAALPGVFDDGRVRTYTGTGGEERFFELVKKGEAVELAVNNLLEPLGEPGARFDTPDAVWRVRTATTLLTALRQLFVDFAALPPERGMPTAHFMDVFRQFAVHWTPGDIPPSGALDAEALKRDFLLGIAFPGYDRYVQRLFPALLDDERTALTALLAAPTLPQVLARSLGVDLAALPAADPVALAALVARHPVLADWYTLLDAHARASGAHLMLSKKFLFKPQAERDAAGLGDAPLVSNRSGTTGMTETLLERLTRARREHALAALRRVPTGKAAEMPPRPEVTSAAGAPPPVAVHLAS